MNKGSSAPRNPRGPKSFGGKSAGNKSYGEKSYGNRSDDNKSYGNRSEGGRSEGGRSYGEKSYGNRSEGNKSYGNRSEGGRSEGGRSSGEKSYGNRSEGNKSYGAKNASGAKPYGSKPGTRSGKPGESRDKSSSAAFGKNSERAFGKERFGNSVQSSYARPTQRARAQARVENQANRVENQDGIRLQKAMANAGVASRRVCEQMITEGRVEVNGSLVVELGARVDPKKDSIHVDGMRLQLNQSNKYFVFNKPKHVMCTMDDPEGRRTIADYFRHEHESLRLFHVGRLDYKTEGLLILTNDGELANRLQHPKYEVPKTYLVQIPGPISRAASNALREGIRLEDGWIKVDDLKVIDTTPKSVMVEVTLHSGRNRIVRRMFDAVGHPVERLVRVGIGPVQLGDQKQGTIRPLGNQEIGHLMAMVGM
ncbi:pseudouridine synthase [Arthrobacter sp. MYb211]|uniref:pseudouridine synthase n=1 Tax=Micrococcaceae TaxID=1268 RepID=UPI000CFC5A83|nr:MULTISPECIES: pseudouridine synthase [unclassified Arthrobacter]PQZ97187.1 pseudouridine synthase [Arthrobacter sp. MYb224]PQZ99952.1 pseudouridine synthase [Arthrobacter sp. MYb229]PRA09789.1 pseudouridine synthase [Arthrobacter sp. MYb221]PRB48372.1 pseudouridine synthase [Arthrobacter sp. MYb216]PRC04024.1 pseudouridine synthase [Arthrobacter sp. MYb211]